MSVLNLLSRIKQGELVYDYRLLNVILPKSDKINSYSVVSYNGDLLYLVYLLNEGIIDLTYIEFNELEEGTTLPDEFIDEYMKVYPPSFFGYLIDEKIWLRYQAWEWLKMQGEPNPLIKRGQKELVSELLNTAIKVHSIRPKDIINNIEKGIVSFGFINCETGMYLFTRTALMDEYLISRNVEKKQRKKTFSKNYREENKIFKTTSDLLITISRNDISKGDIIKWQQDTSMDLKGIVVDLIGSNQSANEVFQNYILESQGCYLYDKDYNFRVDVDSISQERLLIKFNTTPKSNQCMYYALRVEQVELIASYSTFMIEFANWFVENCGFQLKLEYVNGQADNFNAAILPTNKDTIYINRTNMWNTIIHKYVRFDEKPEHTMAIILAHELGHLHPDSLGELSDDFAELVEYINRTLKELRTLYYVDIRSEEITSIYKSWEVLKDTLIKYQSMELQAEYKAWQHGQKFIPNDLLKRFNEDNLKTYEGYLVGQSKINYEVENIGNLIKNFHTISTKNISK